jgi:pimeloyl-ACP methyl ester carboxylesterase
MPGTFSDNRNYVLTVQGLDPTYDLLILENRGVGGSWPPPETSSIEDCAADAIAVLDALGVEKCFVGGHSLGGMIALELGRRIPERMRGVISIEGWTNSQAAKDAFQGDMKSTLSEEQFAEMERYRANVLRLWTAEQRSMFGSIWRKWDGAEFLRTTSLPVLELYGDRNKPRPTQEVLGIPQRDNIEFVWFAGASHSLLVERPAEVAAEINRFVAAHP